MRRILIVVLVALLAKIAWVQAQDIDSGSETPKRTCQDKLTPALQDLSGTWQTNWGTMTLRQEGVSVSGQYTHDEGRIQGQYDPVSRKLSLQWREAPSYSPPKDGGQAVLLFSQDLTRFSGPWGYGDEMGKAIWEGSRKSVPTPPECKETRRIKG